MRHEDQADEPTPGRPKPGKGGLNKVDFSETRTVMKGLFSNLGVNLDAVTEVPDAEVRARAKAQGGGLSHSSIVNGAQPPITEAISVDPQVIVSVETRHNKPRLPYNHPYRVEVRRRAAELVDGKNANEKEGLSEETTQKSDPVEENDAIIFGLSLSQILMLTLVFVFAFTAVEKGALKYLDQVPQFLDKVFMWLYALL